ncbi:MAG: hypothetical protein ACLRWC_06775 [Acutalibacter sp.]
MLDWIFEGIVTWVSSIASELMDAVSRVFLDALGTDMDAMEGYFPFVTKAFEVMQYMAWAVLFLITVWQLFRVFGGPITEAENPWQLLLRSALFALLVGAARPIFTMALDIARAPYTALMEVSMEAEDFTFAGIEEALKNGLTTIVSTVTVVGPILILILLIALGWNYFKLLLECVERYIVVGVLCYTSPLAFAMGGSKATNQVFKSWCRMVGSQLLLLVLNVWFLRAFDSSVGQFIGNGGALASGGGSVFLWLFCALAFLKTAQKFDSYLAAMGLNVAQTGSSMAMEMVMAARVLSGLGGGAKSAGSVFRTAGSAANSTATGAGAAASSFSAGFASKFKGNSYVRDAVVEGGSRMGLGGSVGFVGRAFGGIAARNGAVLTGESISSVASRPEAVSGAIAGDIADRSLQNFMPQLSNYSLAGTQITGGHIHTTATGMAAQEAAEQEGSPVPNPAVGTANGEEGAAVQADQPTGPSQIDYYSASQYEAPEGPYSVVTAADGSTWYQVASGEGSAAFYDVPEFSGSALEKSQVRETFPGVDEGTSLRTVEQGVLEATGENGSALWYNSAFYEEPDAPHSVVQAANGVDWYQMEPPAQAPDFETGEQALAYNRASFQNFMPGFDQQVTTVDGSHREEGHFEVRHTDGSGTQFFDTSRYAAPRGDYKVYEDAKGQQWYAIHGEPAVERKPVYLNGKAVYEDGKLKTTNVETVRYKTTSTLYQKPQRRPGKPPKPPRKKGR